MALTRAVLVQLRMEADQYQREATKSAATTSKLEGSIRSVANAGKLMAAGLAVAAGAVAAVSVKEFGRFDAKLTESTAIMGNLTDVMREEMSDAAREVGRSTKFGADEAAGSFYFLASAGYDAAQSVAALPQVAAFAQAGMFDLSTATDLATDAQSALGLSTKNPEKNLKNLTRVTDVLVKANTLANASVQQFSEALTSKAGAALRILNKDVEEGVGVLAVYADQGLKGAAAGEALSIVLRDLQRSALENGEQFEDLGVSVFDAAGNMRAVPDIIRELTGATDGMSDATRKATLSNLGFQERSVQNIIALLGTADAMETYETKVRDAAGTTQEIADNQMDTLTEQAGLLVDRFKDLAIGIGEDLEPEMVDLIDSGNRLVTVFENLVAASDFSEAGGIIGWVGTAGEALSIFGSGVLELASDISENFGGGRLVADGLTDLNILLREMDGGLAANRDMTDKLAEGYLVLHARGALNAFTMQQLGAQLGATTLEMANAQQKAGEYAFAQSNLSRAAADLEGTWWQNRETANLLLASEEDLNRELARGAETSRLAGQAAAYLAAEEAAAEDAAAGYGDEVNGLTEEVSGLAGALADAEANQRGLASAIKEFTNPVFAAQQAMSRLRDAEAEVAQLEKDGKINTDEWAQAQLDLAEQTVDTQAALDEVSPDSLEGALSVIEESLGLGREEARLLLEQLELIDGKEVTAVINVDEVVRKTQNATFVDEFGQKEFGGGRAMGGAVSPSRFYAVGEDGVELFAPSQYGNVITNRQIRQAMGGASGAGPSTTINLYNPRTNNAAKDLQTGLLLAGSVGRVETGAGL